MHILHMPVKSKFCSEEYRIHLKNENSRTRHTTVEHLGRHEITSGEIRSVTSGRGENNWFGKSSHSQGRRNQVPTRCYQKPHLLGYGVPPGNHSWKLGTSPTQENSKFSFELVFIACEFLQESSQETSQTVTTKENYMIGDSVNDRSFLSDEMAALCAKLPIYRVKAITIGKEASVTSELDCSPNFIMQFNWLQTRR